MRILCLMLCLLVACSTPEQIKAKKVAALKTQTDLMLANLKNNKLSYEQALVKEEMLLAQAERVYADSDLETLEVLAQKITLAYQYEQAGNHDKGNAILKDTEIKLSVIAKRAPHLAKVWEIMGSLAYLEQKEDLEILPYLIKCLELDLSNRNCKRNYDQIQSDYEEPRCVQAKSGLSFVALSEKKNDIFMKPSTYKKQIFFSSAVDKITSGEVKEFSLSTLWDSSAKERAAIRFTFLPLGVEKMARLTLKPGRLAVMLNDKIQVAPAVMLNITSGVLNVSLPPTMKSNTFFKAICKKVEHRKIPAHLSL